MATFDPAKLAKAEELKDTAMKAAENLTKDKSHDEVQAVICVLGFSEKDFAKLADAKKLLDSANKAADDLLKGQSYDEMQEILGLLGFSKPVRSQGERDLQTQIGLFRISGLRQAMGEKAEGE